MFSRQIKVNIDMAWHHVIGDRRERTLSAKDLRRFGSEKCRRKAKHSAARKTQPSFWPCKSHGPKISSKAVVALLPLTMLFMSVRELLEL